MYHLSDKSAAIRKVQEYLYVISDRVNRDVPRVSIDGVYGPETARAVTAFQRIYGIVQTGEVDLKTYNFLYLFYKTARINDRMSSYLLSDEGFPITVGTQNSDVIIIHSLLEQLSKTYLDVLRVNPKSNYFSVESERAVKGVQKIFRMEENGIVDNRFYARMKEEIQSIRRLNEKYP